MSLRPRRRAGGRRRYSARDPAVTSRIMAAVRSSGNAAELLLRRALSRLGLRYRLQPRRIAGEAVPGRPDIVFVSARVIAFVDGDFWHGRALIQRGRRALAAQFRPPLRKWWLAKIGGNAARDRRITAELRARGWLVLRFWESDVFQSAERAARVIEHAVRPRRRARRH
jgi:DNA mismatch endonuclease (patch repair protein)